MLGEAVEIVNLFVDKGLEIVKTRGKLSQYNSTYRTTNLPIDTKIPLAILVTRGSASAAEIVAGSLQDLDRAVIIGQRTFGKGLVQTTRPLSYNTKLKITTAKYYIPSGRCIQALDYTHRNADGSVGHVPDSLIKEFKTKSGRKVFDGGGVLPDVVLKTESFSKIGYNLYTKGFIFDYATIYASKHDSMTKVDNFSITNDDYLAFQQFLKDRKFDYSTDTETELEKLRSIAHKENYDESTKDEMDALAKKLVQNKIKDLVTNRVEIIEMLTEEVVSRYYYQAGRVRASLDGDPAVSNALKILANSQNYLGILNGSFKPPISADVRKETELDETN